MEWWQGLLLVLGGTVAGVINALAGGGSTLTVPLLVLAGVPGNDANGSNRVGIVTSNAASATAFRRLGVRGLAEAKAVFVPVIVGSLVGSYGITLLTDEAFERVFAILMFPVVVLSIRKPKVRLDVQPWSKATTVIVFLLVGLYGGAVQVGVGLVLLAALTRAGWDLIAANNIKVVANLALATVALPVFILQGHVRWPQALLLAGGLTFGGWIGAHAAVRVGERLVRAVMVVAAVLLAGNLLGLS